jgi:hypothetical protein
MVRQRQLQQHATDRIVGVQGSQLIGHFLE